VQSVLTAPAAQEAAVRVLMIAAPGAGKGTQAERIAEHFHVPHLATGDMLREHVARGTELGREVKGHLDRGELVPDEVVLAMVRQALVSARSGNGYVLDGVPRTMPQARACYQMAAELGMAAEIVLHLRIEEALLVGRLLARAADQGRSDDTEEVIRHRIEVYDEVTRPILAWYRERNILVSVDGDQPVSDVARDIRAALTALGLAELPAPHRPRAALDLTGLDTAFGAAPHP